jgi:hypothetical protein
MCAIAQRTGGKTDGCAVFWRSSRYRLVTHRDVRFLGAGGLELMDRDNVAQVQYRAQRRYAAARVTRTAM